MHFEIDTPFWSKRVVGVAVREVDPGMNSVECLYERKDGTRQFPGKFEFNASIVDHLPRHWQKGVELALIPLDKLSVPRETSEES